jgi:TRAP-type C4-dicarboxylate transport system permease small subunit
VAGRIVRFIMTSLPRFVLGALIFIGIAINFANVLGRYAFGAPIIWAEEVLVAIMIWCVFIGAILVTWEGRHIKMDLLSVHIPAPWKYLVNALMTLGFLLVCLFVVWQSKTFVALLFETGQQSMVARLPMGLLHLSILLGFAAMALALLLRLGSYIRGEFGSDAEATTRQVMEVFGGPPEGGKPDA